MIGAVAHRFSGLFPSRTPEEQWAEMEERKRRQDEEDQRNWDEAERLFKGGKSRPQPRIIQKSVVVSQPANSNIKVAIPRNQPAYPPLFRRCSNPPPINITHPNPLMSPGQDSDNDKVRDMEIERPLSRNSIFGNSNLIQRARESIVDLGIS